MRLSTALMQKMKSQQEFPNNLLFDYWKGNESVATSVFDGVKSFVAAQKAIKKQRAPTINIISFWYSIKSRA